MHFKYGDSRRWFLEDVWTAQGKWKYILHNKTFLPIVKKRADMICILIIFQAQIAKSYHIFLAMLSSIIYKKYIYIDEVSK